MIFCDNTSDAKELQNEILAVFSAELDGLKNGLTNYSLVSIHYNPYVDEFVASSNAVDYIKNAKT